MVELEHGHEPAELKRFRHENPGANWEAVGFSPIRPIIREQLHQEQEGLCAYCESKIDSRTGHIDHIKPKASHPQLTFTFENMALSCSAKDHCGHLKADNTLPIEPIVGCNRYFSLSLITGKMVPASGLPPRDKESADRTVSVLGLNESTGLVRLRRQFIKSFLSLSSAEERQGFLSNAPFRWSLKGVMP